MRPERPCVLGAEARFDGAEHKTHLRVAEHEGEIYLDLCNAEWRAVQITADGWSMASKPPVKFVRTARMRSLPEPESDGSINFS